MSMDQKITPIGNGNGVVPTAPVNTRNGILQKIAEQEKLQPQKVEEEKKPGGIHGEIGSLLDIKV
ncbi:hypothetical protein KKH36_02855 [Patescibacteria group bacterium]|nr:hypothetical protein [Patescibacteria group bacterium]